MPGFPALHYLLECAQTPVHWVSDVNQPSHHLSPPFSIALYLSQHQSPFQVSQLFLSGGQTIGASASAWFLPMNVQGWFPLALTGLISLLSQESSSKPQFESVSSLALDLLYDLPLSYLYWENHSFHYMDLCQQNNVCFLIGCLVLSWFFFQGASDFYFVAAVIIWSDFGAQENKICHCFHFFPICLLWWEWMPWSSIFECWVLNQHFHFSLLPSSRGCLVPLHFLPLECYHLYIWGCWYFS